MRNFHTLWIYIPLLNTLQQIFLKESASTVPAELGVAWFFALLRSPWFILALAAEIACFILWLRVLAEHDLAEAFPISSISYVFVLVSAWLFYAEPFTILQLLGSTSILAGVWCLSTARR